MSRSGLAPEEIGRLPLFEGLPGADLERLAASATRRTLHEGEVLFEGAEPGGRLVVVARGQLVVRASDGRRSAIVQTAGPGEIVAWGALRQRTPLPTTVRAISPAEVVEVPVEPLVELVTGASPARETLLRRLLSSAADQLDSLRAQLLQEGREGVITGG